MLSFQKFSDFKKTLCKLNSNLLVSVRLKNLSINLVEKGKKIMYWKCRHPWTSNDIDNANSR